MTIQARRIIVRTIAADKASGFTLIELMIVVGVIAMILALALPVYSNFSIRAKLGEALSVAAAAKTSVGTTCVENPTLTGLTNSKVGYAYSPSKWVQSINVSGDCAGPVITASTQNTGAPGDPEIVLTGDFATGSQRITWICTLSAEAYLLPAECRDAD